MWQPSSDLLSFLLSNPYAVCQSGFENPAIAADAVRAHALAPARTLPLDDFFYLGLIFSLPFRGFVHGPPDPTSSLSLYN